MAARIRRWPAWYQRAGAARWQRRAVGHFREGRNGAGSVDLAAARVMTKKYLALALFILAAACTTNRPVHPTAAHLANCQCWDMHPAPELQVCPKTGNAALDACMSVPPPD